ncbi:hypothetical protein D3C77_314550 [compost metagenome]
MLEGILNDRLNHKRNDGAVQRLRCDLELEMQALIVTQLLNRHIAPNMLDLVFENDP